jgi:hypothetical protein
LRLTLVSWRVRIHGPERQGASSARKPRRPKQVGRKAQAYIVRKVTSDAPNVWIDPGRSRRTAAVARRAFRGNGTNAGRGNETARQRMVAPITADSTLPVAVTMEGSSCRG